MLEKISLLIQNSTISFPRALLTNYRELKLSEEEVLFLIYLINEKNLMFNPEKIGNDLKLTINKVLEAISNLTSKDLIEIKMVKEQNIHKEYLDLEKLYKKLALTIINEESEKVEKSSDLYDDFEKEFGRTLSPNEVLLIGQLIDAYGEELVSCALREAVYNGVTTIRYIDHILAEWKQKGIKNKVDVENDKREFRKNKRTKKPLFEFDYLNED